MTSNTTWCSVKAPLVLDARCVNSGFAVRVNFKWFSSSCPQNAQASQLQRPRPLSPPVGRHLDTLDSRHIMLLL